MPTLEESKELLANVTLTDKLGHLFVVDIVFDKVKEKTLLFNELYPPIFEIKKKIMCLAQINEKGELRSVQQN